MDVSPLKKNVLCDLTFYFIYLVKLSVDSYQVVIIENILAPSHYHTITISIVSEFWAQIEIDLVL